MSTSTLQLTAEHKLFFSRYEAAEVLGVCLRTLDNLLADGAIRFRRVGGPLRGRVLIPRAELDRFAEESLSIKG